MSIGDWGMGNGKNLKHAGHKVPRRNEEKKGFLARLKHPDHAGMVRGRESPLYGDDFPEEHRDDAGSSSPLRSAQTTSAFFDDSSNGDAS